MAQRIGGEAGAHKPIAHRQNERGNARLDLIEHAKLETPGLVAGSKHDWHARDRFEEDLEAVEADRQKVLEVPIQRGARDEDVEVSMRTRDR